jgi:EAL domain-containing protein (putative c-di-GMP-specific phosphodiesterase class I)
VEILLRDPEGGSPQGLLERARDLPGFELMILRRAAAEIGGTFPGLVFWNLTRRSFLDADLPGLASRNLGLLHPDRVVVEVSERGFDGARPEDLAEARHEWVRRCFGLAIDDFGSGAANDDVLLALSPDFVKIDGALARGSARDWQRQVIIRSRVEVLARLGCQVVVEGVETPEDAAFFRLLGVPLWFQGFLWASPLGFDKLRALLERGAVAG